MKRFFLLTAALLSVSALWAQDVIVKRDGEQIKVKIEEIGEQSVRYRKFSNLAGPVYSVARGDVFFIRYESGEKEVVTPLDKPAAANAAALSPEQQVGKQMAAARKKLERKKMWEFGIHAEGGVAGWGLKDDFYSIFGSIVPEKYADAFSAKNSVRASFAASFFAEHYFRKTGEGFIGFGLGYMQGGGGGELSVNHSAFSGSMSAHVKYDAMLVDLYYGWRPIKSGFYSRLGARLLYGTSKLKWEDSGVFDGRMPSTGLTDADGGWQKFGKAGTLFSFFINIGYTVGHSDIGLQYLFGVNERQGLSSKPWAVGLTYNFRF